MWRAIGGAACVVVISIVAFVVYTLLSELRTDNHLTKNRLKLMALGDSITEGYSPRDSYRWHLWRLIRKDGFDVDFIGSVHPGPLPDHAFDTDHEGHSAFHTYEILGDLPGWLSQNVPDIVLLHIGTNDVGDCLDVDRAAVAVERIINLIWEANENAVILLAKIIGIHFDSSCSSRELYDENVRQLNRHIEELSAGKENIVMVDFYSALKPETDFRDPLHPNKRGFKKMAEGWFQALKPILAKSR